SKLRDTSSSHNRTTIVEVMGRECGDIALFSGLAGGAEYVLVPEKPIDLNALCIKIMDGMRKGKLHSIIIKAEGADMGSDELVKYVQEHTGKDTKLVVLSYLQRGGSPTLNDRNLGTLCGAKAVDLLHDDSPSKAIGIVDNHIISVDLEKAINMKRDFNEEMYRLIDVLSK
nr:6-phosphofructokinase [Clostridia bacterium]